MTARGDVGSMSGGPVFSVTDEFLTKCLTTACRECGAGTVRERLVKTKSPAVSRVGRSYHLCPKASGVFRGRHAAMPPFGPTMKFFYRRLYMKRCVFAIFQQELQNSTMFDGLLRF